MRYVKKIFMVLCFSFCVDMVLWMGSPSTDVMSLVQAKENVGSWVYNDNDQCYYYTDANGWKYYVKNTTNAYCYLESIPEDTTGVIKIPEEIKVDEKKWYVHISSRFVVPKGVVVDTAWVYDEKVNNYIYRDTNGWEYGADKQAMDEGWCWVETFPDLEGKLILPSTVTLNDKEWKLVVMDNILPKTITTFVTPQGTNLHKEFFQKADLDLVVYGYAGDEVCRSAEELGFKVKYLNVVTDLQRVQYRILPSEEGESDTVSVFRYIGKCDKVIIPKMVSGDSDRRYTVIGIDNNAFEKSKIASIKLPNTVKSIGASAFRVCTGLTDINIPNGVDTLGEYAFYGCNKLIKATLGTNVTGIGESAFAKCKKLKTIIINSTKLSQIGKNAFNGDKALKTITLKTQGLTKKSIGKNAFKGTDKSLVIKVPSKKIISYNKFLKEFGNKTLKVKKN